MSVAILVLLTPFAVGQPQDRSGYIRANYSKTEHRIKMRDGVELHTVVFAPKDTSKQYPIIMNRTPYSCGPYGAEMHRAIGPSTYLEREGYIFVKQDVRGRWNSADSYDNMRPHVPAGQGISESSDTYDTIEWLLQNVRGNNGKVGITGISYPGFYAAAALPEHHPALVASSPQAPIADFFFDDFHHQGAYTLMYWTATPVFGYQHSGPTTRSWTKPIEPRPSGNAYEFFMKLGPLKNSKKYFGDSFFWNELASHPDYDEFWQRRNILPHLGNPDVPIKTNVMTVGGWFDAEDLYGPLNIYKQIEKYHPDTFNVLVMGPWSHGQWASTNNRTKIGYLDFGPGISDYYQREVELPYFNYFLKDSGLKPDFEALVYDTGIGQWQKLDAWPPKRAQPQKLYLAANRTLTIAEQPQSQSPEYAEFVSDPASPVPYRKMQDVVIQFTPREYMTDDQRFASQRSDVLVFQTDILTKPVTLAGPLNAVLQVSTTQSDADWVVKLIDVNPETLSNPVTESTVDLAGYQQMVRSEVFRSRYRNSYATPEPLAPNQVTEVRVPLQDVLHTFKPGHRIMIQVQSSWFPLIDRNPQKYVPNIFEADEQDFVKATHRVYHSSQHASHIEVGIVDQP
jgi:uncharacterized protein